MTDFSIDLSNSIHATTANTPALQITGDDSLFIAADGSIVADGASSAAVKVTSAPTAAFTNITLLGTITAPQGYGIDATGGRVNLYIGPTASLSANAAVLVSGVGMVTNYGTITANVNPAIWHKAGAATDSLTVINTGKILAANSSIPTVIAGSNASDTIINSGLIQGVIILGNGDDFYNGTSGIATGTIYLADGNDRAYGGVEAELFSGGLGNDVIDGGGGVDTISFSVIGARVDLRLTTQQDTGDGLDTITNVENVNGTRGRDIYNGSDGANLLTGHWEDDNLFGNGGNDTLDGGIGNDILNGGEGSDTIRFDATDTDPFTVDLNITGPQDTGYGTDTLESIENILGGSGADHFTGNAVANIINGGLGADWMSGGAGSDIYYVDNTGDRVIETSTGGTADRIYTSISLTLASYVERLNASGSASIHLTGNTLANTIIGNAGTNRIDGGSGKDVLTGGSGQDTFVFKDRPGISTYDKITDYSRTSDAIQLDNKYMPKLGAAGRLSSSTFVLGTAAKDANDHLIYDKARGYLYYDADGSGAGAKMLIAQFTNKASLAYSEFTII